MLVYLLAIFLIATPIMLSEMIIGRSTRLSAPSAMRSAALNVQAAPHWSWLGWMGLIAIFMILSFYSVIAGWTGAYLFMSLNGALVGLSGQQVGQNFGAFLADPIPMVGWHFAFTAFTVLMVWKGVKKGIERLVKILMPALFLLLLGLVIYSTQIGDLSQAVTFLLTPDLSKISAPVVLSAVGQAFFSVNVGVGAVLTYSAYLPNNVNLFRSALTISMGDSVVALLAGLAIFPLVFAYNLNPAEGPGLIFVTLSTAFAQMPGGQFVGAAFFLLLLFAALTSSVSMLETTTARAIEKGRLNRFQSASLLGLGTFLFGLVTVLSFSSWSDLYLLDSFSIFVEKTPFDIIDYVVSNIMLPIGGVGYVLFAGWWLKRELQVAQLGVGDGVLFQLWLILARVVAPIMIALLFYFNVS